MSLASARRLRARFLIAFLVLFAAWLFARLNGYFLH